MGTRTDITDALSVAASECVPDDGSNADANAGAVISADGRFAHCARSRLCTFGWSGVCEQCERSTEFDSVGRRGGFTHLLLCDGCTVLCVLSETDSAKARRRNVARTDARWG